ILIITCLIMASAMTFFMPNKNAEAFQGTTNIASQSTNLGEMLLSGYENRTDGKTFNGDVFWNLVSRVSGGTITSQSQIDTWAPAMKTSADFRTYNNTLGNGAKDIVVTIGGKQWIATCLTNTANGPILTLWLANSDCVNADGSSYNSNWSAGYQGYTNDWVNQYLGNLYGTSYIRAVTLNNGGDYADTDSHMTTNSPKNQTSPWAIYTVPNTTSGMKGSLTDFIEVPNNVSWQLNQTAIGTVTSSAYTGSYNFNNNNDALNAGGNGETGNYLTELNRNNLGNYYKAWGADTLWLPSVAETGVNGVEGIWKASNSTRANSKITWLRSAYCGFYYRAYRLTPDGTG
ncbi:MAG: hypothetical protein K2J13_03540, partial [Clostridia bacterium]|nr:hypothetical protein [Clostridia bacterium]